MSDTKFERPVASQANGEPEQADAKSPPPKTDRPWYKRPLWVGVLMFLAIALTLFAVLLWRHLRTYQSTDDAYIDIQSEDVSAQIPGRVLHVNVNDNQDVTAGQVLVNLDPGDFQTQLEQVLAAHAQAEAQVEQAKAQVTVVAAQVEQAKANRVVAEANATNAVRDLARYEDLRRQITGAVSEQQIDAVTTQVKVTAAQLAAASRAEAAAQAQLDLTASQIKAAEASAQSATARVEQARLNLSYTEIKAHLNGRVANKTVAEGNYIQPGAALMALVPSNVFVTANFKETQLNHIRRGQPVAIRVAAYPDLKLRGHVDGVQPGAGQVFSLLPPQNATGNWVKIVQRVPVKIVLENYPENPEQRLAPGMSVDAKVTVR